MELCPFCSKSVSIELYNDHLQNCFDTIDKEKAKNEIISNEIKVKQEVKKDNGELSKGEFLFWKVFKNLFIRSQIFSNLSKLDNYSCLTKVSTILGKYSNGFEIIKDKLKSNSPLDLLTQDSLYFSLDIFKHTVKNNRENKEFLFQYFNLLTKQTIEINIESIIASIFYCGNLLALKTLGEFLEVCNDYWISLILQFLSSKPTILVLYSTYDEFKFIYYLLEKIPQSYELLSNKYIFHLFIPINSILETLKLKQILKISNLIVKYNDLFEIEQSKKSNYIGQVTNLSDGLYDGVSRELSCQYFSRDLLVLNFIESLLDLLDQNDEKKSRVLLYHLDVIQRNKSFDNVSILKRMVYLSILSHQDKIGRKEFEDYINQNNIENNYLISKKNLELYFEGDKDNLILKNYLPAKKNFDSGFIKLIKSLEFIVDLLKSGDEEGIKYIKSFGNNKSIYFLLEMICQSKLFSNVCSSINVFKFFLSYFPSYFLNEEAIRFIWQMTPNIKVLEYYENHLIDSKKEIIVANLSEQSEAVRLSNSFKRFKKSVYSFEEGGVIIDLAMDQVLYQYVFEEPNKLILEKLVRAHTKDHLYKFDNYFNLDTYLNIVAQFYNSDIMDKILLVYKFFNYQRNEYGELIPFDISDIFNKDPTLNNKFLNLIVSNFDFSKMPLVNGGKNHGTIHFYSSIIDYSETLKKYQRISPKFSMDIQDFFKMCYLRGRYMIIFFCINNQTGFGKFYIPLGFNSHRIDFIKSIVSYLKSSPVKPDITNCFKSWIKNFIFYAKFESNSVFFKLFAEAFPSVSNYIEFIKNDDSHDEKIDISILGLLNVIINK